MADNGGKKITLKSSDGEEFEVPEVVAMESQVVRHVIEDCAENSIPLPNVNSKILSKVIEYCKKHVAAAEAAASKASTEEGTAAAASVTKPSDEDLKTWDAEFVKVDQGTLIDLILAADYLNIKGLLDLTCQTAADMIKGMSPEEMREFFNIKNDYSHEEEEEIYNIKNDYSHEEEEEEIRRENKWALVVKIFTSMKCKLMNRIGKTARGL